MLRLFAKYDTHVAWASVGIAVSQLRSPGQYPTGFEFAVRIRLADAAPGRTAGTPVVQVLLPGECPRNGFALLPSHDRFFMWLWMLGPTLLVFVLGDLRTPKARNEGR